MPFLTPTRITDQESGPLVAFLRQDGRSTISLSWFGSSYSVWLCKY